LALFNGPSSERLEVAAISVGIAFTLFLFGGLVGAAFGRRLLDAIGFWQETAVRTADIPEKASTPPLRVQNAERLCTTDRGNLSFMPPPTQDHLDALALEAAIEEARAGLAEGGIPIGAALVAPDGTIVACGPNLRVQNNDTTLHGETACLRNAGRRRDWHTLTMATTLSPCPMCSGAAVLHRLHRVVIGENRTFQGREDWLREAGIQVHIADDPRCVAMMREFIAARPELWDEDIGLPPR
jgi:cytosine deaminase